MAVCAIGPTLQSIHTDGSRRCLTWTSLSPTAVPLWLRMQRTNPFARLSLAQFLTLGPFLKGLGEPQRSGIQKIYHSGDLTILNVIWGPRMTISPHDHQMWAVIGIYTGREDNIFLKR